MAKELIFFIAPITKQKIKAVVNWIDKEAGLFGVSFIDKYPYDIGGDVLSFTDKNTTWSFK